MADKTASPFQIRNLAHSEQTLAEQDTLVRISGPGYDRVISDHPAATLRYRDEENDTIILGSSHELLDKLEEPAQQSSKGSSRKTKNRMSIAMLLSEAEQNPQALRHHVFDIEEREEIKKLWQEIQRRNKTPPPALTNTDANEPATLVHDAVLVRLRENGKELKDISKEMDDKSTSSCKLRYQEHPDRVKRDKLAAAYERRRKTIWSPIATDLGISWEEAEDMHWDLGKQEISRRVQETARMDPPQDLLSAKSTNVDSHEDLEFKIKPSPDGATTRKFEDYRTHHFNTTKPPRTQSYKHISQMSYVSPNRLKTAKLSLRPSDATPRANLTVEGKRQAQAAGDILRSRTMPSRHRKAAMILNDHAAHQNRWAEYKSFDTPFSPRAVPTIAQDSEKLSLTSEGKRQAQAAGDKLRCRTNPIRHSRPSRSGSSEHGIHKNRWSSYVAPRAARLDTHSNSDTGLHAEPQSKAMEPKEGVEQPSLLEVFEAELAKDSLDVQEEMAKTQFPDPEISTIPQDLRHSASLGKVASEQSAPSNKPPLPQQPIDFLSGIMNITNHLQKFGGGNAERPQDLEQFFENGVRTAVGGLDTLVQGLTDGLQEVSDQTQHVVNRAREVDAQGIDVPFKEIQDLILGFTTKLNPAKGEERSCTERVPNAAQPQTLNTGPANNENPSESPSPEFPEGAGHRKVDAEHSVFPAKSRNEDDPAIAHTERPLAPLQGKELKEKIVLCIRHKLQKGFLVRDETPKEDEMKLLSGILTELESCSDLDASTIRATKIHKVLKAITRLPLVPLDDIHHIKSRSIELRAKFKEILSNDDSTTPSAGKRAITDTDTEDISESHSQPSPRHLAGCVSQEQQQNQPTSSGIKENVEAPRFHKPGPIHLPHYVSSSRPASALATSFLGNGHGYIDGLHRSQTTNVVHRTQETQIPSPTPVATRFPTLAQFESGQDFASNSSFPALPTMEALKPQSAFGQHKEETCSEQPQSFFDFVGPAYQKPLQNKLLSDRTSINVIMDGRENPACLPNSPIIPFAQAPAAQQNSVRTVARDIARSQGQTHRQEDQYNMSSNPTVQAYQAARLGDMRRSVPRQKSEEDALQKSALQEYQTQLMLLEEYNKERLGLARHEQGLPVKNLTPAKPFPSEETHKSQGKTAAQEGRCSPHADYSDSAARLAGPFDPLEAEPSAQPDLTEGIRRNATVSGTDSHHNARRRRPYSEAYDGRGRVAWNSFLGGPLGDEDETMRRWAKGPVQAPKTRETPRRSQTVKQLTKPDERQRLVYRCGDATQVVQRMPIKLSKVDECVEKLRELGYGNDDDGFGDRLLVYAQAAEGILEHAIEMIDEEQRVYAEMF